MVSTFQKIHKKINDPVTIKSFSGTASEIYVYAGTLTGMTGLSTTNLSATTISGVTSLTATTGNLTTGNITTGNITALTGTLSNLKTATMDGTATGTANISMRFTGSGGQAYGLAGQWANGSGGHLEVLVGSVKRYIQLYTGTTA